MSQAKKCDRCGHVGTDDLEGWAVVLIDHSADFVYFVEPIDLCPQCATVVRAILVREGQ